MKYLIVLRKHKYTQKFFGVSLKIFFGKKFRFFFLEFTFTYPGPDSDNKITYSVISG